MSPVGFRRAVSDARPASSAPRTPRRPLQRATALHDFRERRRPAGYCPISCTHQILPVDSWYQPMPEAARGGIEDHRARVGEVEPAREHGQVGIRALGDVLARRPRRGSRRGRRARAGRSGPSRSARRAAAPPCRGHGSRRRRSARPRAAAASAPSAPAPRSPRRAGAAGSGPRPPRVMPHARPAASARRPRRASRTARAASSGRSMGKSVRSLVPAVLSGFPEWRSNPNRMPARLPACMNCELRPGSAAGRMLRGQLARARDRRPRCDADKRRQRSTAGRSPAWPPGSRSARSAAAALAATEEEAAARLRAGLPGPAAAAAAHLRACAPAAGRTTSAASRRTRSSCDVNDRVLHYWGSDGFYRIYPTSVPLTEEMTRRGRTTSC